MTKFTNKVTYFRACVKKFVELRPILQNEPKNTAAKNEFLGVYQELSNCVSSILQALRSAEIEESVLLGFFVAAHSRADIMKSASKVNSHSVFDHSTQFASSIMQIDAMLDGIGKIKGE